MSTRISTRDRRFVRKHIESNRPLIVKLILLSVLPAVAGAVNACGFFAVGTYTSHMTGIVARLGDEIAHNGMRASAATGALLLAFFVGAITSTVLVEVAKRRTRARYMGALLLEAAALLCFVWLGQERPAPGLTLMSLLCFAMGMQNALVTKMSGAVVRTTHLTGIVTDAGIEVVRLFYEQRALVKKVPTLSAPLKHPELQRLRLYLAIFISFLAGAILGPALYMHYGRSAVLAPVAVLFALVVFDFWFGLDSWRPQHHEPREKAA